MEARNQQQQQKQQDTPPQTQPQTQQQLQAQERPQSQPQPQPQPQPQRMFILNVVSMMGFKYVFNVCTDEFTIPSLKQLINHYLGIPVEAFKIVKDSSVLYTGSLRDHNIRDGASVQIVPNTRSGLLGFSSSSSYSSSSYSAPTNSSTTTTTTTSNSAASPQLTRSTHGAMQSPAPPSLAQHPSSSVDSSQQPQMPSNSTTVQLPSSSAETADSSSSSSSSSVASSRSSTSSTYSSCSSCSTYSDISSSSPLPPYIPEEDFDEAESLSSEMYHVFYPQSAPAPAPASAPEACSSSAFAPTPDCNCAFNLVSMNEDPFEESNFVNSGDTILTSTSSTAASRTLVGFPGDMSSQVATTTRTITHTTHMMKHSYFPAATTTTAAALSSSFSPIASIEQPEQALSQPPSPGLPTLRTPDENNAAAAEGSLSRIQKLVAKIRSTKKSIFNLSRPIAGAQPLKKHTSSPKSIPTKPFMGSV